MWVENADRWVAGFLEMFEEGCHKMVSNTHLGYTRFSINMCVYTLTAILTIWASVSQGTAIRDRIQESLRGQPGRGFLEYGDESDGDEYYYDSEEEYYDDGDYDSDEK